MTILEAVNDLGHSSTVIKESAKRFLSGKDGMLQEICERIDVNHKAIINSYKELGPKKLQKMFLKEMQNRETNASE
jgi:hypothetical protein